MGNDSFRYTNTNEDCRSYITCDLFMKDGFWINMHDGEGDWDCFKMRYDQFQQMVKDVSLKEEENQEVTVRRKVLQEKDDKIKSLEEEVKDLKSNPYVTRITWNGYTDNYMV
jgi:hypothetical protein